MFFEFHLEAMAAIGKLTSPIKAEVTVVVTPSAMWCGER
jgi:hypothetical protein